MNITLNSFIILLALFGLVGCGNSENHVNRPLDVGDKIPDLIFDSTVLNDVKNKSYSSKNFKGDVIVLNFWASWCGPCRKEMPSLQKLSNLLEPAKFKVIGVSVDDDVNLAQEFLLQQKISFLNLHDQDKIHARNIFGIDAYPVTFIIAADGTINRKIVGEQVWDSVGMQTMLNNVSKGNKKTTGSFAFGG